MQARGFHLPAKIPTSPSRGDAWFNSMSAVRWAVISVDRASETTPLAEIDSYRPSEGLLWTTESAIKLASPVRRAPASFFPLVPGALRVPLHRRADQTGLGRSKRHPPRSRTRLRKPHRSPLATGRTSRSRRPRPPGRRPLQIVVETPQLIPRLRRTLEHGPQAVGQLAVAGRAEDSRIDRELEVD